MELNSAYLQQQLEQLPRLSHYYLAFSGGVDSHVLFHLLVELGKKLPDLEFSAIHIHHGLQHQADSWAEHCQQVGAELNVKVRVVHVSVSQQGSLEAAAREARYKAFAEIIKPGEGLMLAHHNDDQAETVLLQLFRGAGVPGLAAMPAAMEFAGGWLLRPLLKVARVQILDYARHHELSWIEDPSNLNTEFDRNFIRHEVLPILQHRWPSMSSTLSRSAAHQAEASKLLEVLAEQDYQDCKGPHQELHTIAVSLLLTLEPARQRNVLRYWLRQVCHLPLPDTRHMQRILTEVLTASADATPLVEWQGAELRRYRDELYAQTALIDSGIKEAYLNHKRWDLKQSFALPDGTILKPEQIMGVGLKASLIGKDNIRIGFRKGGEHCRPAGRGHRHSLKKLMQEWGIPPWLRERVPLILVDDEIAQVVGYCLCEPFQADSDEKGVFISLTDA